MTATAASPGHRPAAEPTGEGLAVTTVFTVAPQHQRQLYTSLTSNARDVLEHAPGFLGSTLTRCDDGLHVIHHAYWRDEAALAAMLANPTAQTAMAATRALAQVQIFRSHHIDRFNASA